MDENDTIILRFESDKYDLNKLTEDYVSRFFNSINLKEKDSIFITGHTDYTGNVEYNKQLSLNRAAEVKSFLRSKGIQNSIVCSAKADFQPVSKDTSAIGKRKNRRVEVIVKHHKTIWIQKVQVFPMTNNGWYTITTTNGCFLKITPNSVKTALEDSIYIRITEYNSAAEYIANRIPMSYDSGNKIMLFDSEQMMKIEAFSKDKRELGLNKLFELECPHVDTTNGVKFYQLQEIEDDLQNLKFEYEYGRVVISEKVKEEPKEDKFEPEVPETTVETLAKPSGRKKKKKLFKKSVRIRIPSRKKKYKSSSKPDLPVIADLDTGRIHIVIDTGRVRIHLDTIRNKKGNREYDPSIYTRCRSFYDDRVHPYNLCSETQAIRELLQEVKEVINTEDIDYTKLDFYTLCERFKSPYYVRGLEKENLTDEEIYGFAPQWKIRKRLLKREIVFKLKKFPANPEYNSLKKVKWSTYFGDHSVDKELLLSLRDEIVDFRVKQNAAPFSLRGAAYRYNLELKTIDGMFTVPVKSKLNSGELAQKVSRYEYVYQRRQDNFNSKVSAQLNDAKIIPVVQLLQLLNQFVYAKRRYCVFKPYSASDLVLPLEIRKILRPNFSTVEYNDNFEVTNYLKNLTPWLHELKENKAEINRQIDYLVENLLTLQGYVCQPLNCEPGPRKWEHKDKSNNYQGRIIRVGLGIYNFDRQYFVEAKRTVLNPLFIDENRNILLNEDNRPYFQAYSLFPGIKGLMAHSSSPQFKLVKGRVNVLFFHDKLNDKMYKAVYDLRNGKTVEGNTFQLRNITEQGKTIKGLKEELEKVEW